MILYHCMTWLFFVDNKNDAKFMYNSNHTGRYRKQQWSLTPTKHNCTLSQYIFNWNASVTGHKRGTAGFPQRKPLSRSTVNSTVTTCTFRHLNSISCGYKAEAEKRWNNASELEGRRTKIVQGYINRLHSCHPTPIRVPLLP